MARKILLTFLMMLVAGSGFAAPTVVKTFNISKTFSNIPGTPRIVRNGFDHEWLVVWRQQGAPSKIIGRRILSDGSMKKKKILEKGTISSEIQSFDVGFDSVNYNYLLAFETSTGLQTQLFDSTLGQRGAVKTVESGVSGTVPRFGFDHETETYLLFWLGDQRTTLKVIKIDSAGNLVGTAQTLAKAPAGNTFLSLNVSTNPANGNFFAIVLPSNSANGKLQGFNVKPDGTLLRKKPTALASNVPGLNVFADATFDDDSGSGLALWSEGTSVKRRKLSQTGKNASVAQEIPNEADADTTETAVGYDSVAELFIGTWTKGSKVRAAGFDTGSVAASQDPFDVATSNLAHAMNATTAYDGAAGHTIVVWEDSTADAASIAGGASAKFRVRGAIFFIEDNGGGGSTDQSVTIGDNFYRAADGTTTLNVNAGDTVTWTNNGNSPHTVTSDTGAWSDSGTLNRGATFSFRFTTVGTFKYHCTIHGAAVMSGTIVVTDRPEPYYP